MFAKAVEWNMIKEETLKRVRKVKMLPENNRRLRFLSEAECQSLIKACETHLKPIVITSLNTKMRRGEILNLKWEQVDLRHGFILLGNKDTKNMEIREIPINGTLKQTLLKIMRRLDIPYVFYDPKIFWVYHYHVGYMVMNMKKALELYTVSKLSITSTKFIMSEGL